MPVYFDALIACHIRSEKDIYLTLQSGKEIKYSVSQTLQLRFVSLVAKSSEFLPDFCKVFLKKIASNFPALH